MMTSLFSSFDPCSTSQSFSNWSSTLVILLIIPCQMWLNPNRHSTIMTNITNNLHLEFKTLTGTRNSEGLTLILLSILFFIALNNFLGLFPYIFTSTSHLVTALSVAMPFWLAFMLFGWINNMNHMFAHQVPMNTPYALMPFMVIIETISNVIRPMTLAVRLSANMIAGHLLLTLLGNQTSTSSNMFLIGMLALQISLLSLEWGVAIIQAYVFTILSALYSTEVVKNHSPK